MGSRAVLLNGVRFAPRGHLANLETLRGVTVGERVLGHLGGVGPVLANIPRLNSGSRLGGVLTSPPMHSSHPSHRLLVLMMETKS